MTMYRGGEHQPLWFNGRSGPVLSSADTSWAGPPFEVHQLRSIEGSYESACSERELGLMVILRGAIEVELQGESRTQRHAARTTSAAFISGSRLPCVLKMEGDAEVFVMALTAEWLKRLLVEDPERIQSKRPFAPDPTLHSLATAMRDEVARDASTGRLYAESLSTACLSYALAQLPPEPSVTRGHLSDAQQRRLRNYMLDHFDKDLSIGDLAALVGQSPRHFSTLFKRAFGTTPHRYLLELRLSEGARRLSYGGCDIAELALSLGFCSQSHFSSAFQRVHGVSPGRYARQRRALAAGF